VRILNKEWARGKHHKLQQRLEELPIDLHELFLNILTRDSCEKDDVQEKEDDKAALLLCIQLILFARQPLSPEQLYHALLPYVKLQPMGDFETSEGRKDVIRRFLLNCSKGLVEITIPQLVRSRDRESRANHANNEPEHSLTHAAQRWRVICAFCPKQPEHFDVFNLQQDDWHSEYRPIVQFIHESVRHFFLKDNGLGQVWPETKSNFVGQSHERLKLCCADHIDDSIVDYMKFEHKPRASLLQHRPFAKYAVRYVLYHADLAEAYGISQSFLDSMPLPHFFEMYNVFSTGGERGSDENVTYTYILAELNLPNLLMRFGPSVGQCISTEPARYGYPLFAAAFAGGYKVVELFLRVIEAHLAIHDFPKSSIVTDDPDTLNQVSEEAGLEHPDREEVLECDSSSDNDSFFALAERLKRLRIRSRYRGVYDVFLSACQKGCVKVVRALLPLDPSMIETEDDGDCTPLYGAVERRDKPMVEMLIGMGADVNAKTGPLGNALNRAVSDITGITCHVHKEDIVAIMLENGANITAKSGNAFHTALAQGDQKIVNMMFKRGFQLRNRPDRHYGNTIQAASMGRFTEIVAALREYVYEEGEYEGEYYDESDSGTEWVAE
jgi:hypothetical protein